MAIRLRGNNMAIISYNELLSAESVWGTTKAFLFLSKKQKAEVHKLRTRRIGDHLVTQRTGYTHHGIYIGSDQVIHYSGFANGMNKGKIETTSLDDFMNGQFTFVKRWHNPRYRGDSVVKRAQSRLGEDEYNLLTKNCEHFAAWCITGKSESEQVNTYLKLIEESAKQALRHKSKDWTKIMFPNNLPLPYRDIPLGIPSTIPSELISKVAMNRLSNTALSSTIVNSVSQSAVSSTVASSISQTAALSTMSKAAGLSLSNTALPVAATLLAAKTIYDNSDTIKEVAVDVVDTTAGLIGDTVEAVGEGIDTVVTGAINFLDDLFS